MAIFNIPRAGRQKEDYVETLVNNMFQDERLLFKQGYGLNYMTPSTVIDSFDSVYNAYCKVTPVRVHTMEVILEHELGMLAVSLVASEMGKYLYSRGYQSLISAIDTGESYVLSIVVNAVSFINGSLFHDNNAHYQMIFEHLRSVIPLGWDLTASDNAFFVPGKKDGNYTHGMYA